VTDEASVVCRSGSCAVRHRRVLTDAGRRQDDAADQPAARLRRLEGKPDQEAEKMPEADYTFKPGSTPEARTFAQVIAHIAQSQLGTCSALKGVPNPMAGKNLEQELKTKAEVTKALADSFALCDEAFANVTDANATEFIKIGQNEVTRVAALYGLLVHGNEIYGTGAVYLRSKNIVPPSTERMMQGPRPRQLIPKS
jgi:hypothetical protein